MAFWIIYGNFSLLNEKHVMQLKHNLVAIIAIFFIITSLSAQNLDNTWQFDTIVDNNTGLLLPLSESDTLNLNKGVFSYHLKAKNNLKASGNYIYQNNLLVFYYDTPGDTIRKYNITAFTDSTLVFQEKEVTYKLKAVPLAPATIAVSDTMIPSEGFSLQSLWRGVLGMISLIFIAYLFSSNRKGINWKTIGIGLGFQLLIAIGVLKVPFVKVIFEFVGRIFVEVLNFTISGSEFLFSGLVSDMDSFGFIFAFQVLPTILFFSALTSVLFYLGIIQKVVKAMAWLLTKSLKISGAESLSVAGNIFLGQTEAPLLIKEYLEK